MNYPRLLLGVLLLPLVTSSCRTGRIEATPSSVHQAAGSGDLTALAAAASHPGAVNVRDAHGKTPIFYAVSGHQLATVRWLLEHGADANPLADNGQTPLLLACRRHATDIATVLIDHGAELDRCGDDGLAPLSVAVLEEQLALVDLLLARGAGTAASLTNSHTPLTFAILKRDPAYVERLLAARADPNQPGLGANTPLHVACAYGNQDALARLIAAGAELRAVNAQGLTPLDLALLDHRYDLVMRLIERWPVADLRRELRDGDPFRYGVVLRFKADSPGEPDAAALRAEATASLDQALAQTTAALTQAETRLRQERRRTRNREIWATVLVTLAQGAAQAGQQTLAAQSYSRNAQLTALRTSSTPSEYHSSYSRIMAGYQGDAPNFAPTPMGGTIAATESAAEQDANAACEMLRVRIRECTTLLADLRGTPAATP